MIVLWALLALLGPGPHRTVGVLEYRAGVANAHDLGERLATILSQQTSIHFSFIASAK